MRGKPARDLTGKVFGKLVVERRIWGGRNAKWFCRCECGNTHIAEGRYLKTGLVKSCGCIQRGRPYSETNPGQISSAAMNKASDSLDGLAMGKDPYENLANAIVAVAADDYRTALKEKNETLKKSLEDFFFSDWYKVLTNIKPEFLIKMLQLESDGEAIVINM